MIRIVLFGNSCADAPTEKKLKQAKLSMMKLRRMNLSPKIRLGNTLDIYLIF
jgi:hypothetical protein